MVAQPERIPAVDSPADPHLDSAAVPARNDSPPNALASLNAINAAFLQLLCHEAQVLKTPPLALSLARCLPRLSPLMVQRIANCPFALFDLRTTLNAQPVIGDVCGARIQFANAALFQAWNLVRAEPARARLWFGIDAQAVKYLRELSAYGVASLAASNAAAIKPRCAEHVLFWPGLLRHAESGDSSALQLTMCLGRQLVSAQVVGQIAGRPNAAVHNAVDSL